MKKQKYRHTSKKSLVMKKRKLTIFEYLSKTSYSIVDDQHQSKLHMINLDTIKMKNEKVKGNEGERINMIINHMYDEI
jgi:hypothetical protein